MCVHFFVVAFEPYFQQDNLITYQQIAMHCTVLLHLALSIYFSQFQVSDLGQQHISWFAFFVKTCGLNILTLTEGKLEILTHWHTFGHTWIL